MSTDHYVLGRGVLSIAEWTGGSVGSFVDAGNCPKMNVNLEEEKLEHYSHRSGLKTKDKVVTLETGYTVEFDLDEISSVNLARFLKATTSGAELRGLQNNDADFALRFVSANAAGENQTWNFHKVKLAPASAFEMIGDEWAVLSFTAEGQSDVAGHPTSPMFTVSLTTTTTTTTTTTGA